MNPITTTDSRTAAPHRLSFFPVRWASGIRRAASSLRDMPWLDTGRTHVYAIALIIACIGILAKIISSLHNGHDDQGLPFGADYASFWAASRLVFAGLPADTYVVSMHHLAELPVLVRDYEAFYYPPPYLILCIPLAMLPFFPSLVVFLLVTWSFLAVTLRVILRTVWAVPAILAFPALSINIIAGQNVFLTAAILGSGLSALDRRPKLSGAILGLMIIKPHLAFAVPIALIISRRWTVLASAGATALGVSALSYAIFGWDVWAAFFASAHNARDTLEQGAVGFIKMQSAFAAARALGVSVATAYITQCAAGALSIYILIKARRLGVCSAAERSLTVLACLMMTPFLLFYDMLILAIPLAWMLREWIDCGFPPWSKLVLVLVFCAPMAWLMYSPIPFGQPALLLFVGYLWWCISRRWLSRAPQDLHRRTALTESAQV